MKKISLNSIKEHLSRDEMREISGGSGGGNGCCTSNCSQTQASCVGGGSGVYILCVCNWNHQTLYNILGQVCGSC